MLRFEETWRHSQRTVHIQSFEQAHMRPPMDALVEEAPVEEALVEEAFLEETPHVEDLFVLSGMYFVEIEKKVVLATRICMRLRYMSGSGCGA